MMVNGLICDKLKWKLLRKTGQFCFQKVIKQKYGVYNLDPKEKQYGGAHLSGSRWCDGEFHTYMYIYEVMYQRYIWFSS